MIPNPVFPLPRATSDFILEPSSWKDFIIFIKFQGQLGHMGAFPCRQLQAGAASALEGSLRPLPVTHCPALPYCFLCRVRLHPMLLSKVPLVCRFLPSAHCAIPTDPRICVLGCKAFRTPEPHELSGRDQEKWEQVQGHCLLEVRHWEE